MNTKAKFTKAVLVIVFVFTAFVACEKSDDDSNTVIPDEDIVTNPKDTTFSDEVIIEFVEQTVQVTNPFSSQGVKIDCNGADVVVESTIADREVNYVLTGKTVNGSLKIYSDMKFGLGLNGVDIANGSGAAINIQSSKKAIVTLVGGTNNRLIDALTYADSEEDEKGTFFSEGQMEFVGSGKLQIYAYSKHGICSDDYIEVNGGSITVVEAKKDAMHANDYIEITAGVLTLGAQSDGVECEEGYINITGGLTTIVSGDEGVVASYEGDESAIVSDVTIGGTAKLSITTLGEKASGIKSDIGAVDVSSGDISITTNGAAAKAINSHADMVISGGKFVLATTGNAFYDQDDSDISSSAAIKCDGDLLIEDGTFTITATGSAGKGISVDGTLTIDDGQFTVTTSGSQFVYGSSDSEAKAIKSDGDMTINDGQFVIKTSTTGAEGLESKTQITINDGDFDIQAYDDCINAIDHIQINGGKIYCYSPEDDAADSNGTITITGGLFVGVGYAYHPPQSGLDCDTKTFTLTGGTVLGFASQNSSPTENVSTQYSIAYGTMAAGWSVDEMFTIKNDDGAFLMSYRVPRTSQPMAIFFTSGDVASGADYNIYRGGAIAGGTEFHGLYLDGSHSGGSLVSSFTTSSLVSKIGDFIEEGGGRPPRP